MGIISKNMDVIGNNLPLQILSNTIPANADADVKVKTIASKNLTIQGFIQGVKNFTSANKVRILQAGAVLAMTVTAIATKKYIDSSAIRGHDNSTALKDSKVELNEQVTQNKALPLSLEDELALYFASKNFTLPKAPVLNTAAKSKEFDVKNYLKTFEMFKGQVEVKEQVLPLSLEDELILYYARNNFTLPKEPVFKDYDMFKGQHTDVAEYSMKECMLKRDSELLDGVQESSPNLSYKILTGLNEHFSNVSSINADALANNGDFSVRPYDRISSCNHGAGSQVNVIAADTGFCGLGKTHQIKPFLPSNGSQFKDQSVSNLINVNVSSVIKNVSNQVVQDRVSPLLLENTINLNFSKTPLLISDGSPKRLKVEALTTADVFKSLDNVAAKCGSLKESVLKRGSELIGGARASATALSGKIESGYHGAVSKGLELKDAAIARANAALKEAGPKLLKADTLTAAEMFKGLDNAAAEYTSMKENVWKRGSTGLNDHFSNVSSMSADAKANIANFVAETSVRIASGYHGAVSKGLELKDAAIARANAALKEAGPKLVKVDTLTTAEMFKELDTAAAEYTRMKENVLKRVSTGLNDHFSNVSSMNADAKANIAKFVENTNDKISSCYHGAVSSGYAAVNKASIVSVRLFNGAKAVVSQLGEFLAPPKYEFTGKHPNLAAPIGTPVKYNWVKKHQQQPFASSAEFHKPVNTRKR